MFLIASCQTFLFCGQLSERGGILQDDGLRDKKGHAVPRLVRGPIRSQNQASVKHSYSGYADLRASKIRAVKTASLAYAKSYAEVYCSLQIRAICS